MFEWVHSYYAYTFIMVLLVLGLYGMLIKRNLMKKLIGMVIFQNSIILLFVVAAYKHNATVPVYDPAIPREVIGNYLNPLPHTLMLTAIVVGVAVVGVAFAILIAIYQNYKTLDEDELMERMK